MDRVTHELVGRMARLWGAVVIGTLLMATGGAGPTDQYRLLVVPARSVTDPIAEQSKRVQSVARDERARPDAPQALADRGTERSTPPAPPEGPRNEFARLAPVLEAVVPLGDSVPVYSPIVIKFSQPMARAGVEHSLAIRPAADGQLLWLDDFTVRLQPIRLAHGQVYEVRVGGRSMRGVPLAPAASWHFTTVAAPPVVLPPGPSAIRVPILMYHYIRVNPDPNDRLGFALSVTPSDFAAQMDWLAANGYHPITFEDLYAYLSGQRGLPGRPVILTFDDGYADFYTAVLPILRAHDFSAVAYVVSGFIGRSGYMTAAQVAEADRSGVEIGAHTVDHVNLASQSRDGLGFQVTASKEALEKLLGHPVLSFCRASCGLPGCNHHQVRLRPQHGRSVPVGSPSGQWRREPRPVRECLAQRVLAASPASELGCHPMDLCS